MAVKIPKVIVALNKKAAETVNDQKVDNQEVTVANAAASKKMIEISSKMVCLSICTKLRLARSILTMPIYVVGKADIGLRRLLVWSDKARTASN